MLHQPGLDQRRSGQITRPLLNETLHAGHLIHSGHSLRVLKPKRLGARPSDPLLQPQRGRVVAIPPERAGQLHRVAQRDVVLSAQRAA